MRRKQRVALQNFTVAVLDDDQGIIDSLQVIVKRLGYNFIGFTEPEDAINIVKEENADLLILDYLMEKMNGNTVVSQIRKFNTDLFILLLTGHKDLAPPLETIRQLDIQGYCEKSDRFDQLILMIESALKSISQVRKIRKYEDGLNKILGTVPKIYQLQPISIIIEEILTGILPLVNSQNAFILNDTDSFGIVHEKIIYKGIGKFARDAEYVLKSMDSYQMEMMGKARTLKVPIISENIAVFPLVSDINECIGLIYIESEMFGDGIQLLDIYTKQAASSLNNAFLHSMVNIKNEELKKTYDELKTRYLDTIEVLRLAVDAKDVYTRGHSDRVSYYAVLLGEAFDLSKEELELLHIAGVFHDVGKIGTADDILYKTESLNTREYDEVKKHTITGAHILSAVSMFKGVVPIIRSHHERIDGRGYPDKLKEHDIPLLAKILSVADAFDAMTTDRLYRSKLNLDEAKLQLIQASGTQFDPIMVDKFLKLIERFDEMQEELAYTFI